MLNILSSNATAPSEELREVPRRAREDNLRWLRRNLPRDGGSNIVLVGGISPVAFRLRVAQSHVRHDLRPSHWSHVLLLDTPAPSLAETTVYEIHLEAPRGFGFPPPDNAVQEGLLGQYQQPAAYPNIAILNVPVAQQDVLEALRKFKLQRAVLDAVDLLARWLAYVWGIAATSNPLLENFGIPSSAMLEIIFGAAGFDLTPGLESRASCPEAIWQAAKWWHEHYAMQNRAALTGAYYTEHKLVD
jgi:hypothetical protein